MKAPWIVIGSLVLVLSLGWILMRFMPSRFIGARLLPSTQTEITTSTAPAVEAYCQNRQELCQKACNPDVADEHSAMNKAQTTTPQEIEQCQKICVAQVNDCKAKTTEENVKSFEQYNH